MKRIEVTGTVDEEGNLHLDKLIPEVASHRVRVIIFSLEVIGEVKFEPDNPSVTEIEASLRRALQEAASGQRLPLSQMWEGIDE